MITKKDNGVSEFYDFTMNHTKNGHNVKETWCSNSNIVRSGIMSRLYIPWHGPS